MIFPLGKISINRPLYWGKSSRSGRKEDCINTLSQWHMWFAWYPIYVNNDKIRGIIWWEDVMRRRVLDLDLCDGSYKWEYETIDGSAWTD